MRRILKEDVADDARQMLAATLLEHFEISGFEIRSRNDWRAGHEEEGRRVRLAKIAAEETPSPAPGLPWVERYRAKSRITPNEGPELLQRKNGLHLDSVDRCEASVDRN
jgi:hypothetical protein